MGGGGDIETSVNATDNVLLCVLEENDFKTGVPIVLMILTDLLCIIYLLFVLCQQKYRIIYFHHSCSWQLFKSETKTKMDCIIRCSSYRAVNTASLVRKVRQ